MKSLRSVKSVDKTIKLTRKVAYIITAGIIILLAGRIFYLFHEYSSLFMSKQPKWAGIVVGLFAGGAVFRSAGFFQERTAVNLIHYIGIALTLRTVSYAAEYLLFGIPRLIVYAIAAGSEILALYGCVAHLREIAKERNSLSIDRKER